MKRAACSIILLLGAVGCASESTSRRFDISYEAADAKLRQAYPPTLTPAQNTTIKRDEVSHDRQERIVINQLEPQPSQRTEIMLDGSGNSGCEVSVQVSKSKKSVIFPSRDTDQERDVLNKIAEVLK